MNVTHANQLPAYMFYSRFASTRGCCVRNLLSPCSLSNYQFPEPGPTGFSPCVEDFSKRLTTLSTTSPLVLKCFGTVAAACRGIEHNTHAPAGLVAFKTIIDIVYIIGPSAQADLAERATDNGTSETRAVPRVSTARAGKNQMRSETSNLQKISSLLHLCDRNIRCNSKIM